jgi:LysR family glycine cleavage system transcriptional activator
MPARPPSLRAIAAFDAAARHESFAKAAEELNLTQSAISHSIRALEDRLDATLFARRGRKVALTDEGRALAERLRVSLALMSQALSGLPPTEHAERLVIAAPSVFIHDRLVRRWSDLARAHPSLTLELRPDLGIAAVQAGEADLCIHYGTGAHAGLAAQVLAREAVFPVAAPHFDVDPDDLTDAALIENSDQSWALWFGHFEVPRPSRPPALTVRDLRLALDAARAGLGVCLARGSLVADALRCGDLVRLGERSLPAAAPCQAVWRAHGPKLRLVARFVDWLADEVTTEAGAEKEAAGRLPSPPIRGPERTRRTAPAGPT